MIDSIIDFIFQNPWVIIIGLILLPQVLIVMCFTLGRLFGVWPRTVHLDDIPPIKLCHPARYIRLDVYGDLYKINRVTCTKCSRVLYDRWA